MLYTVEELISGLFFVAGAVVTIFIPVFAYILIRQGLRSALPWTNATLNENRFEEVYVRTGTPPYESLAVNIHTTNLPHSNR